MIEITLSPPISSPKLRHTLSPAGGIIGGTLLACIAAMALFAPWLPLQNPLHIDLHARFIAPLAHHHLFGTDQLGRDLLSRVCFGGRFTVFIGIAATAAGALVGVSAGLVAGYFGGITDRLIMRLVDIELSIPVILLALLVIAVLGPGNINLVGVLTLTSWVRFARIIRAETLALRQHDFVHAARVIGVGPWRLIFRHILPNVWPSILTIATLEMSRIMLMEVALSFLGLGVQPPAPGWGRMLAEGRNYITTAWWVTVAPGVAILLTVLSVNLIGDALRRTILTKP